MRDEVRQQAWDKAWDAFRRELEALGIRPVSAHHFALNAALDAVVGAPRLTEEERVQLGNAAAIVACSVCGWPLGPEDGDGCVHCSELRALLARLTRKEG